MELSGIISIITIVFVVVLFFIFFKSYSHKIKHTHAPFTAYTPTLLTSVGILGTFLGIILGLLEFDPNEIDKSISTLLEGLKTAFITSLVGMFLSITYKIGVTTGYKIPVQSEMTSEEDVTSLELYEVMKKQAESTELVRQAIAGDEDSSLVSLIKLQRSDANDHHKQNKEQVIKIEQTLTDIAQSANEQKEEFVNFQDRLWRNLQEFADMLSKSATEQVIEALKQVIQDFNNNLVESFGENFKQLNEAVIKLVEWQENYKVQLGEMEKQYAQGVEAITKTESSVANISEEAKVIPSTMSELKHVMEINQHQISELDRHLGAFEEMKNKAVEAVPEIKDQIEKAIAGAKQANDQLAKGILESGQEFQKIILEGATDLKDNVSQATGALSDSATVTANSSEKIKEQFSEVIAEINNNLRNLVSELEDGGKTLNESFKQASSELISESGELQKTFTKGLNEMQTSLSSTIEEQAREHRRNADSVFAGLEKTIQDALSGTGESVQKQLNMIEDSMGGEIEKVMSSMGGALASISGQFTSDYSELVEQMKAIVRQA
jgi:DNA repair exonuclease SbcCD ATPase subunit